MKDKKTFKDFLKNKTVINISSSVIAVILGLIFGLIVILIANPSNAFAAFGKILAGGFSKGAKGVGEVLYKATPLILTGLSVAFAFKTGLFNIGATGQYTMGFCFSLFAAFLLENVIQSRILWVFCLIAGFIGGMLWGAIPGIFKAFLNVNEVITCIMTNYIGLYLVDMIIRGNTLVYNTNSKWTKIIPENANIPKMGLDKIFSGSNIHGGIIIAIIIAILIWVVINKTKLGYELRACGHNKEAARYAGINQNTRIILSMLIAGGLAGLAGAVNLQAGTSYTYAPINSLSQEGFNGIAVALLGTNDPIGTVFAAIFFSHIRQGGFYMQTLDVKSEIIDVIIGAIIYFAAFALFIKNYLPKIIDKISDLIKRIKEKREAKKLELENKEEVK